MYDAVAEAMPLAQQGQNRKKALLVISDGNDTASATGVREVKQQIRESEVLVYAIGIDGEGEPTDAQPAPPPAAADADSVSVPGGGRGAAPAGRARRRGRGGGTAADGRGRRSDDRVNVAALRDMTDDSGGRTEIVRDPRDLEPGDREHRRRVEQAVLPRLSVDRQEGRPLARDPRRSSQNAPTACARAAATSRASDRNRNPQ